MSEPSQCDFPGASRAEPGTAFPDPPEDLNQEAGPQSIVVAGGCFWCVEAVFRQLKGVSEVVSGYAGGSADTANYQSVCSGRTAHAEVVRIEYEPQQITLGQILKVFFSSAHDPTQVDRQGNDVGTQYRSAIFYANSDQQRVAQRYIELLDASGVFTDRIATRMEPLGAFHVAEAYHQNYAALNPHQPYIAHISTPKVEKLRSRFPDSIRDPAPDG